MKSWKDLGGLLGEALRSCADAGVVAHATAKALHVDSGSCPDYLGISVMHRKRRRKHQVHSVNIEGPSLPWRSASLDRQCRAKIHVQHASLSCTHRLGSEDVFDAICGQISIARLAVAAAFCIDSKPFPSLPPRCDKWQTQLPRCCKAKGR